MKNIKLLLIAFSIFTLNSCDDLVEAPQTPFATFEMNSTDIGVEQGGEISKDIKIYTANVTNSDRTIGISVDMDATDADPAAYTVAPSVTIPAGSNEGVLTIGLKDIGLDEDKTLKLSIEQTEDIYAGEDLVIGLSQLCPNMGVKVKITLGFDNWPEEIAWRILDSNGVTVLASADPFAYGAYAGMTGGIDVKECLASGTYTIQIYDGYGDGGTSYVITANGAGVLSIGASDYGGSTSASFSI